MEEILVFERLVRGKELDSGLPILVHGLQEGFNGLAHLIVSIGDDMELKAYFPKLYQPAQGSAHAHADVKHSDTSHRTITYLICGSYKGMEDRLSMVLRQMLGLLV